MRLPHATPTRIALAALLMSTLGACKGKDATSDTGADAVGFPNYTPGFTVIAKGSDDVDKPQDLEFHPDRPDELWVVNKGADTSGSSMVIIQDAGLASQSSEMRRDGNARHFMNSTSAIAFSDNGNWANSPEVLDANNIGSTDTSVPGFTGPSLWSSNLDVFAMDSGGNGSHLDMLHESPFSMGIASDAKNAFWLFDGFDNELVWYDFGDDHGPGQSDHSDGKIKRYSDMPLKRKAGTPSHMVVDRDSGWLYIANPGNSEVLRMDTTSGSKDSDLPMRYEGLEKHFQMKGEVWEVFADTNLQEPSGVAVGNGELYVTDNATGEIIAYSLSTGDELGRIQTDAQSIMGITVGPDGSLFYVDRKGDKVIRVDQN